MALFGEIFDFKLMEIDIIVLWEQTNKFDNLNQCFNIEFRLFVLRDLKWLLNGTASKPFPEIKNHLWVFPKSGEDPERPELSSTTIGALIFAALMVFAGWVHYHIVVPKLAWFEDIESMLDHNFEGQLGLDWISWAGWHT